MIRWLVDRLGITRGRTLFPENVCELPRDWRVADMPEIRSETELRQIFAQDFSRFEGCDKSVAHYFIATAGRFSEHGSFDHGVEVYQWRTERFIAEVWFNDDGFDCVAVREKSPAESTTSNASARQ